jgi:NAD(P)H-flavin reductase
MKARMTIIMAMTTIEIKELLRGKKNKVFIVMREAMMKMTRRRKKTKTMQRYKNMTRTTKMRKMLQERPYGGLPHVRTTDSAGSRQRYRTRIQMLLV